jgi:hypothetical protein
MINHLAGSRFTTHGHIVTFPARDLSIVQRSIFGARTVNSASEQPCSAMTESRAALSGEAVTDSLSGGVLAGCPAQWRRLSRTRQQAGPAHFPIEFVQLGQALEQTGAFLAGK